MKYKEDLQKIYKNTASLNLYTSICNAKKERILSELIIIKKDIEKLINKLET